MVFNEPEFLPIWFSYYANQVGAHNCIILDHGSDDGSTAPFQDVCSVVMLPRTPHSNVERAALVSRHVAALLVDYQSVIYSDVDEIVIADPKYHRDLVEYSLSMPHPVVTAIGMDVVHDDEESCLGEGPILAQRKWARPLGFLCKPVITRRDIDWWSGFHGYNGPALFDRLYLFHLAMMDREMVGRRQIKKNKSAPVDGGGAHHRKSPERAVQHVRNVAASKVRISGAEFDLSSPLRYEFLDELFGMEPRTDQLKNFRVSGGLWEIPERFKRCV